MRRCMVEISGPREMTIASGLAIAGLPKVIEMLKGGLRRGDLVGKGSLSRNMALSA
jgi:hypothetical protein